VLDPFGNQIFSPINGNYSESVIIDHNGRSGATFQYSFQNFDGPPIAAISAAITCVNSGPDASVGLFTFSMDVHTPAAARMGLNKPVTIVAYQGVAAQSVITVSGVTNFELIPNPVLRQNLQLTNGYADEKELEYAKNLLHYRHKIGLKSIWKMQDYWAMRPALEQLADINNVDKASAFGRADLIKFFKNKFLPYVSKPVSRVLSSFVPELAPAFNAIGDHFAKAASGIPIRSMYRAMTQRPVTQKPQRKQKSGVIKPPQWRIVFFPTIITLPNSLIMKGGELFAVSTVKPLRLSFDVSTSTIDKFKIYGIQEDTAYHLPTGRDLWVFAVDATAAAKHDVRIIHGDPVSGTSAETAIYLAAHGRFNGVYPYPVTGELDDKLNVMRNPAFSEKMRWLAARGLPLAGNDPEAKPKITNIKHEINV